MAGGPLKLIVLAADPLIGPRRGHAPALRLPRSSPGRDEGSLPENCSPQIGLAALGHDLLRLRVGRLCPPDHRDAGRSTIKKDPQGLLLWLTWGQIAQSWEGAHPTR